MSMNKYKKLFEDEAGYKEIPFPVKIEILAFLEELPVDEEVGDDSADAFESLYALTEYCDDPDEYPNLFKFDLAGTKILEFVNEIMRFRQESYIKEREFWQYLRTWNIKDYQIYKTALQNFQKEYGNVDPLQHMSADEFLGAFGKKDSVKHDDDEDNYEYPEDDED